MDQTKARAWFGVTALVVAFGIVVQVTVAANAEPVAFDSAVSRALNVFAFFTIPSNLIVGIGCLLLALNPNRSSTAFKVFRLTSVVAIAITGIVFHSVLKKLLDLESWALVADHALHTVVPVMAVVGWLLYGPRGLTSPHIARLSVIFPAAWLAFTLIRGATIDFYPYPFIDVTRLGYAKVLINSLWVAVLYLAVAAGFSVLDRWLVRAAIDARG
jgi:hypothetical protein